MEERMLELFAYGHLEREDLQADLEVLRGPVSPKAARRLHAIEVGQIEIADRPQRSRRVTPSRFRRADGRLRAAGCEHLRLRPGRDLEGGHGVCDRCGRGSAPTGCGSRYRAGDPAALPTKPPRLLAQPRPRRPQRSPSRAPQGGKNPDRGTRGGGLSRGRDGLKDRQAEFRRVARTRVAALEAEAIVKIELHTAETITRIIAHSLTSRHATSSTACRRSRR